jgi:hypothetical protein
MSQFKPGEGGRPKGAANKFTTTVKERIENVLDKLDETLFADLMEMEPSARVELWAKLQEYIRPKLSRTAVVGPDDGPVRGVVQIEIAGPVRPPTTSEKDVSI